MTVRKAVILTAGFGTRLLPATKAVPKAMLPLVDRPIIQYIVEEALASGLDQIIMVTSGASSTIEDHFDRQFELEQALEEGGKQALLADVRSLAGVDMAFVRQRQRLGNGHAVLIARPFVGDEPFAIFFADDVIVHDVPAIKQLLDVYEKYGHTVLAVQTVPDEDVPQYGIIDPAPVEGRVHQVRHVIEKPSLAEAPSRLATVGRFVVTPQLFDALADTPPGRSGEVWLMDAFERLLQQQPVYACEYEGERFDAGRPIGLLKASISLALQRQDLRPELTRYLHSLTLD